LDGKSQQEQRVNRDEQNADTMKENSHQVH